MSRTKHTEPKRVLATRRLSSPWEPRGANNRTDLRQARVLLKECGIQPNAFAALPQARFRMPRIRAQVPRPGYQFTVSRRDLIDLLEFFGDFCRYGLKAIELRQGPLDRDHGQIMLGRLLIPGTIILYDHPSPPWILQGGLAPSQAAQLRHAGALIKTFGAKVQTVVDWPGNSLRDFLRFEVFMHEVGHHLVQQYTGKRLERVMRTKDHEIFATRFAQRCRSTYLANQCIE